MIDKLVSILKENDNYLILTHENPDGDAMGSAIALKKALESIGKEVDFYGQYPVTSDIESFVDEREITKAYDLKESYAIGLCLDCSSKNYLYGNEFFNLCESSIVIDHHVTNEKYGNANIVSPKAAATAELIYVICSKIFDVIPKDVADLLYVALSTDTGNFSYQNTTPTTHLIASKLLKLGADGAGINEKLKVRGIETLNIKRLAYENIYAFEGNRILVMVVDAEGVNADTNTEGIIDDIRYIKGCEVAALIKRADESCYKVSLRSSGNVDVAAIAGNYGGGGHKRAAGFTYEGSKVEVLRILKDIDINEESD